jgi:nitroreductase
MREQRAVMAGKSRYYAGLTTQHSSSLVGLRRNIHRLEKALLMKPRRDVFAKDYILETVEWYKQALNWWLIDSNRFDESELNWANNVLSEYFNAVKADGVPVIERAKKLFEQQTYQPAQKDMFPYKRLPKPKLPTYEQMLSLSMHRRSVRWYTNKKVSRKDIDDALLVARQSPTACNRLPYEFRIFDDPDLVKKVANTPFGTGGYADNIPVIAVLIGKLDSYFSIRDRHAIYVDTSLAAMSFAFALETKGLSSCMINWPDFEPLEHKMQKLLKLRVDERPIMLMAIGYADPDSLVAFSQKKSLTGIRRYNFEDSRA